MSASMDRFSGIPVVGVRPDRRSSAVWGGSFVAIAPKSCALAVVTRRHLYQATFAQGRVRKIERLPLTADLSGTDCPWRVT
jgi:hypothetical protein